MGVCVLVLLHVATIDQQQMRLIGPPEPASHTWRVWSDAWKIDGWNPAAPAAPMQLAFQSLAPAGGSDLGATGYMSRRQDPTFGAGGSYAVHLQQNRRYRQAQGYYGVPGLGYGYRGYGGYRGLGLYGGRYGMGYGIGRRW